jgi:hypothetical protein
MKMKKWQIGLVLGIIFANANIHAQSIYETSACDDSLYLKLKGKNINVMTPREYEYFILKEKECTNTKTIFNSTQSRDILPTESCEESRNAGKEFAEKNKFAVGIGWGAIGIGAGFATGIIGGSAMTIIASVSNPTPDTIQPKYDQNCYKKGYKSVVKRKRILGVITGTIIGTTAVVLILLNQH